MKKIFKDYYEILSVSPVASEAEIKKAYRRMARKYHPDVAPNRRVAEEAFKEINEAHEVLSNHARRRSYDALRGARRHEADFSCTRSPEPQPDSTAFREGHRQDFGFRFDCGGRKNEFDPFFQSSRDQGREGFDRPRENHERQPNAYDTDMEVDIVVTLEEVMQGSVRPLSFHCGTICEACAGLGRHGLRSCMACGGNGRVIKTHDYRARIPAGVRDGQRLKLADNGESGARGLGGDLYLRVRLAKHPVFRVQDGALLYELVLRPSALEADATSFVPTLNGRVLIKIPAGVQDGQRLRVRDQGLPLADGTRGDLFITIRVQATESASDVRRGFRERTSNDTSFCSRR